MFRITTLLLGAVILLHANETYYYYQGNEKITLTPLKNSRSNDSVEYYMTSTNHIVGITDTLLIRLLDPSSIDTLLQAYPVKLIERLSSDIFLLQSTDKTKFFNLIENLRTAPGVLFAHPDFIQTKIQR